MRRVRLADEAKADLREIGRFSRAAWGVERTRIYLAALNGKMWGLLENPLRGSRREDIDDLRSVRSGRHVVFYEVTQDGVRVLRILHDQMDHPIHLNPRP